MIVMTFLRQLFGRGTRDREMSEEMCLHVDLQTEINIAAGMDPDEARQVAQRQFGHLGRLKAEGRDRRGVRT